MLCTSTQSNQNVSEMQMLLLCRLDAEYFSFFFFFFFFKFLVEERYTMKILLIILFYDYFPFSILRKVPHNHEVFLVLQIIISQFC